MKIYFSDFVDVWNFLDMLGDIHYSQDVLDQCFVVQDNYFKLLGQLF